MAPTTLVRPTYTQNGIVGWQVQDGDWDECVPLSKAQRESFCLPT